MDMIYILRVLFFGLLISSAPVEGILKKVEKYVKDFIGGAKDMVRNYNDMNKANTIGSDKYFHAKANFEAAKRGPGGKHAAKIISDVRESVQFWKGVIDKKPMKPLVDDMIADQRANKWGRDGGDPNKYRPKGLDKKYKK